MSLITQPPQAQIFVITKEGNEREVVGTEEDIGWLAKLLFDTSNMEGQASRFLRKNIRRIEHYEFGKLIEIVEFGDAS